MALSGLETVSLRDLKLETHHRGRVLIVKTFCEPKRIVSIMSAVEDQNGDVARIALYNITSSKPIDKVLPKDVFLAIKEPYYTPTIDGGVLIRIDHPSDLSQLDSNSRLIPSNMMPVKMPKVSPTEMREKGNAAFKRHDWQEAVDCYSAALGSKQLDEDLRRTLHCNRSQARINLGHYELAIQDALAATIQGNSLSDENKSLNGKSLYRAARAAYELGEFTMAEGFFSRVLESSPENKDALGQLERTENRLREQRTGEYDLTAMTNSATRGHTILDHASFLSNTTVASAGDHGRGLFATKHLAPGEIIMVEKAFYAHFKRSLLRKDMTADLKAGILRHNTNAERMYEITDKILHNPKQASQFLDLYDGGKFQNKTVKFVDGMVTVDTFRALAINDLNGFGCPDIKSSESAQNVEPAEGVDAKPTGVWLRASRANHSCIPNSHHSFIGDMMVIRATRSIKVGEEIRIGYRTPEYSYPERKQSLSYYGFDCDCPLCEAEKYVPPQVLSKRARLIDEFDHLPPLVIAAGSTPALPPDRVKILEHLMAQLEETYPEATYRQLPRLDCVRLALELCAIHDTKEENTKRALRALRDLGYFVNVKGDGVTIDRSAAVVLPSGLIVPMVAAATCLQAGKITAAWQLQELRREMYIILHACDAGLLEFDKQLWR